MKADMPRAEHSLVDGFPTRKFMRMLFEASHAAIQFRDQRPCFLPVHFRAFRVFRREDF